MPSGRLAPMLASSTHGVATLRGINKGFCDGGRGINLPLHLSFVIRVFILDSFCCYVDASVPVLPILAATGADGATEPLPEQIMPPSEGDTMSSSNPAGSDNKEPGTPGGTLESAPMESVGL
ncbi:hypothetical protein QYF36_003650 [Acer negundo]|nr:hypothetical protein QYF36_003650 [Acer negundo]